MSVHIRFKLIWIRFGYPKNASPDPVRTYTFYRVLDPTLSDTKTFPGFACQALVLARQPAARYGWVWVQVWTRGELLMRIKGIEFLCSCLNTCFEGPEPRVWGAEPEIKWAPAPFCLPQAWRNYKEKNHGCWRFCKLFQFEFSRYPLKLSGAAIRFCGSVDPQPKEIFSAPQHWSWFCRPAPVESENREGVLTLEKLATLRYVP